MVTLFAVHFILLFRGGLGVILVLLVGLWVLVGSILFLAGEFLAPFSLEVETKDHQQLKHIKDY